jgi:hypothetical protein
MDTQAVNKAFATHRGDDAESGDMAFEWTVDDVVRSIRTRDGAPRRARRWMVALGALVVAVAATATIGLSADDAATTPAAVALPARIAAAAPGNIAPRGGTLPVVAAAPGNIQPRGQTMPALAAAHDPGSRGRALVVIMPADRDYVAATSIPVAGLAFGRPHGPRVSSVHVALYVGGRLVEGTDLAVYSGRFAGVLGLDGRVGRGDAELRFSDPANPARAAVIRSITLDPPSATR